MNHSGQSRAPIGRPSGSSRAFRLHRNVEHPPALAFLRQDAPDKVVLVPARRDDDDRRARFEAGDEIEREPLRLLVADEFRVGVLSRADRIIDQDEIGAPARNRAADTGRKILALFVRLPSPGRRIIWREAIAQDRAVLLDEVANPPAPSFGQFEGMRRRDDRAVRRLRQIPRWKQDAREGRFCRAGWQGQDQPVVLAARDRLKLADDDPMVRRRLETAQPRELSETFPDEEGLQRRE